MVNYTFKYKDIKSKTTTNLMYNNVRYVGYKTVIYGAIKNTLE